MPDCWPDIELRKKCAKVGNATGLGFPLVVVANERLASEGASEQAALGAIDNVCQELGDFRTFFRIIEDRDGKWRETVKSTLGQASDDGTQPIVEVLAGLFRLVPFIVHQIAKCQLDLPAGRLHKEHRVHRLLPALEGRIN